MYKTYLLAVYIACPVRDVQGRNHDAEEVDADCAGYWEVLECCCWMSDDDSRMVWCGSKGRLTLD